MDAALLTSSFILIKAQESGARVLATAEGHIAPILVSTTTEHFAHQHPELIEAYIDAQRQAMRFIQQQPAAAIAIGAQEHGITPQQAKQLCDWSALTTNIEEQDLKALYADATFLIENDLMRSGLDVFDLIAPTSATSEVL